MALHVKKGDQVMVIAGKDKGRRGTVLRVDAEARKVLVQNINVNRKHRRPTQANPQGGVMNKEMPLDISNVALVVEDKPTRVRYQVKPDGSKVRVSVRTGQEINVVKKARG